MGCSAFRLERQRVGAMMRHRDADETQARLRKAQSMRHGDADKTQARFRLERHRVRATRTGGWLGAGVGCED